MTRKHIRKRILLKFSLFLNSSNKICVVLGPELLTFTNNPNLLLLRVQDAWRLESRSWKEALGSCGEGMWVCSLRREQVLFYVVPIPRAPALGCGPSILLMTGWGASGLSCDWRSVVAHIPGQLGKPHLIPESPGRWGFWVLHLWWAGRGMVAPMTVIGCSSIYPFGSVHPAQPHLHLLLVYSFILKITNFTHSCFHI